MTTSKQSIQPLIKTTNLNMTTDSKEPKVGSLIRWLDDGDLGIICSLEEKDDTSCAIYRYYAVTVYWLEDGFDELADHTGKPTIRHYADFEFEVLN